MSVGADSEQPSTSEAGLLKEQGNAEFKAASYLKAAATYTRAIKLAASLPTAEQAVLYSNRSAALLQLSKVTKALADADECIRLRPDWDKGYYRQAAALEKLERWEEALAAYQASVERGADSRQVQDRIRHLRKVAARAQQAAKTAS